MPKLLRFGVPLVAIGVGLTFLLPFARLAANGSLDEKRWVAMGSALISAGGISYVVAESVRWRADEQRKAAARREFLRQLLGLHNQMKAAQQRLIAHATVRTYGIEIRDTVMPCLAAFSRLTSDIGASNALSTEKRRATADLLSIPRSYLKALSEEFECNYLDYSYWQLLSHERQSLNATRLAEHVAFDISQPPDNKDKALLTDSIPWENLRGNDGLSWINVLVDDSSDHTAFFSDPVRTAMRILDPTMAPESGDVEEDSTSETAPIERALSLDELRAESKEVLQRCE